MGKPSEIRSLISRLIDAKCHISCTGVRIYNLMREVGSGKLKAENALLQMVEDYKNNGDHLKELDTIEEDLEKFEEELSGRLSPVVNKLRSNEATLESANAICAALVDLGISIIP